jgi:hypothetical protein
MLARLALACALAAVVLAPAARAAAPEVPLAISYQGVLLDTAGVPRTGNVDLTLRVYDAPSGGALVYKQVYTAVPLTNGVFSVLLGPTGSGTDTPANPLTTSLGDALGGDVGPTAPSRFLQVTVGTEGALARTQIVSAPYAMRAESAATADIADDVETVNGLPSGILNQLYEFGNADGSGPLNTDPREGTADVDGDGAWNFNDPDNDGDGIPDVTEIGSGNDINVVSPTLTSLAPSTILSSAPIPVVLTGAFFDPALTVSLNGAPIAASGITASSATIAPPVGVPVGTLPVYVQRANGERSTTRNLTVLAQPPGGPAPPIAANAQVSLSVKNGSFVLLSGDDSYGVDTDGNGAVDQVFEFDLIGNPGGGVPSQIAVAWGPAGEIMGLRCRPVAGGCQIQILRDSDGNAALNAATDTLVTGPTFSSSAVEMATGSIGFDASGNLFSGFGVTVDSGDTVFGTVHDRNGDGDFGDANETVTIETTLSAGAAGTAVVDPSGRLAFAFATRTVATGPALRVAYDRNGDGDFVDAGELYTATGGAGAPGTPCGGIAFDPAGRLAAVWGTDVAPVARILRDLTGDGDFADPGDSLQLHGTSTQVCGISGGSGLGVMIGPTLLVDRNNDGDFVDTNESQTVATSTTSRVAVARNAAGRIWVGGTLDGRHTFVDPL